MRTNIHDGIKKSFSTGRAKDSTFQNQKQQVFKALSNYPKTMLMVSIETSILRANICRYVAEFQKENRIKIVRKGICPISKHGAGFYTTNLNSL